MTNMSKSDSCFATICFGPNNVTAIHSRGQRKKKVCQSGVGCSNRACAHTHTHTHTHTQTHTHARARAHTHTLSLSLFLFHSLSAVRANIFETRYGQRRCFQLTHYFAARRHSSQGDSSQPKFNTHKEAKLNELLAGGKTSRKGEGHFWHRSNLGDCACLRN